MPTRRIPPDFHRLPSPSASETSAASRSRMTSSSTISTSTRTLRTLATMPILPTRVRCSTSPISRRLSTHSSINSVRPTSPFRRARSTSPHQHVRRRPRRSWQTHPELSPPAIRLCVNLDESGRQIFHGSGQIFSGVDHQQ